MPAASRDDVAGTASWEPPLDGVMDGQPGTGMRRRMILLPGITRRAACHHCRRRSIPWTTLAHGLNSTTGESATVPGRPAPLCLFAPSVSGPTYRDPSRTTLARNLAQYRADAVLVFPPCRPYNERLGRGVAQPGSALDWGSRGRRFKSCRPDQFMVSDNGGSSDLPFFFSRIGGR